MARSFINAPRGDYNGLVFRLGVEDFPLTAGSWFRNRAEFEDTVFDSPQVLATRFDGLPSGEQADDDSAPDRNWCNFERILPHRIAPTRIIQVIKDREPRRAGGQKTWP